MGHFCLCLTIALTPTFYTFTVKGTPEGLSKSYTAHISGRSLAELHHVREPSIGLKSILTSPSLEKLGWEEKLLPLVTAVLAESLIS